MSGRWVTKHTCDGNGPFPCDDRCRRWVEDEPVTAPNLDHIEADADRAETWVRETLGITDGAVVKLPVGEARWLVEIARAAQAWDATLSHWCDGPERDALRAALSRLNQDTT